MSRVQKFGKRAKGTPFRRISWMKPLRPGSGMGLGDERAGGIGTAARRHTHPSNKQQMTKWFYRLLIVSFLLLINRFAMVGKAEFDKF